VVTGLLYIEDDAQDLHAHLNTVPTPLNSSANPISAPAPKRLEGINAGYR